MPIPASWSQFPIGNVNLSVASRNIEPDSLGNLYFPTLQGVAKYNIASDTITFITTSDGLVSDSIGSIAIDSNDDIWILQQSAVSIINSDIILQKFDTGLNSVTVNVSLLTLFGIKSTYGGGVFVKINPFNGDIFVGENRQTGNGVLATFNGVSWLGLADIFVGLVSGASFQFIEFLTVDQWWLGFTLSGSSISLVFWDNNLSSTIFSFSANNFGGSVEHIALLSTGRLIVLPNAGVFSRIDSGIVSATAVTNNVASNAHTFVDSGDLIWSSDGFIDVVFYDDSIPSIISIPAAIVGGQISRAIGKDLIGNIWTARDPNSTALLSQGLIPIIVPSGGLVETITTGGQLLPFDGLLITTYGWLTALEIPTGELVGNEIPLEILYPIVPERKNNKLLFRTDQKNWVVVRKSEFDWSHEFITIQYRIVFAPYMNTFYQFLEDNKGKLINLNIPGVQSFLRPDESNLVFIKSFTKPLRENHTKYRIDVTYVLNPEIIT